MTLTSIVILGLLFTAADQMSLRIANGENRNVSTHFFVQVITVGWVGYGGMGTAYRNVLLQPPKAKLELGQSGVLSQFPPSFQIQL